MGIIFSDKAKRVQVKDLLGTEDAWMLNRLQAGRDKVGFNSVPHRLSKEELEKVKDEYIYVEESGGCIYARFEKSTDEIRTMLGLSLDSNPFDQF